MELQGDFEAMIGTLRVPGSSIVIEKDGRGFEQIQELRSLARRIGLRDRTAFNVEDRGKNIEVILMNIAPQSPLRKKRGPAHVHHAWHDLEVGKWHFLPNEQVKSPASLRVQVSKWSVQNSKIYSVVKVDKGYRIWRRK